MNIQNMDEIIDGFIENIVLKSTAENPLWNSENKVFSKVNRWNYIDACMIKAITKLYEIKGDESLFYFAKNYTDSFISEENTISSMNPEAYNLDNINGGKNLLYFYKKTTDEKYLEASKWIYENQLKKQPRLKCGNFWHKLIYPNQIWLDGIYMTMPFLAEYSELNQNKEMIDDIKCQLEMIRKYMKSEETGLYYHGYDEEKTTCWANKKTGLSSEYWLRSMGWLTAGLVDTYEITDNTDLKNLTADMLGNLLESLIKYQDENGMFYQLPIKKRISGNYQETSGTALYTYSALKSYRLGICSEEIKNSGIKALNGIIENYIDMNGNMPILKNICLVAGLGGEQNRDGSEQYYLNEPIVQNDAKGIAPFIMAYTEYIAMS